MKIHNKEKKAIFMAVALLLVVGCAPKPASIEVDPADAELHSAGEELSVKAKILDDKGMEIVDAKPVWTIAEPQVANVDESGRISAKSTGDTTVTVTAGEAKVEIPVRVAICSKIEVPESEITITMGESKIVDYRVLDENGKAIGVVPTWKISDESVARVSDKGEVTGMKSGQTTLSLDVYGLKSAIAITVAAPKPAFIETPSKEVTVAKGDTVKIEAKAMDAENKPVSDAELVWKSENEEVVAIAGNGEVTGVAKGSTNITISLGDIFATVQVTVTK